MFSSGANNIYNSFNPPQNIQNVNFIQNNNISNFNGNIDSLIEYKFSKINSNIQSGNFYQIKNNFFKRVYVISKTDFEKLLQLNNNMYPQNLQGFITFYSTINEIMTSLTQSNIELYFVREEFFLMKNIQLNDMNHVDFYKDENKI